jgi:hypothetical protein
VAPGARQTGQVFFDADDLPEQVGGLSGTGYLALVEQGIPHVLEPLPLGLAPAVDGAVVRQAVDEHVEIDPWILAASVEPLGYLTDLEFKCVASDYSS